MKGTGSFHCVNNNPGNCLVAGTGRVNLILTSSRALDQQQALPAGERTVKVCYRHSVSPA
jgi:hypothetical protein